MALTMHNMKRWVKMLLGKSVSHHKQICGTQIIKGELAGYYSDLRHKVLLCEKLSINQVPVLMIDTNRSIEFSIDIFQYGLGAYDLFIETGDECYETMFKNVLKWTMNHQEADGSFKTFDYKRPEHPFSSMAQGEAASLLLRGYKKFNDQEYYNAAKKAIDFMLLPIESGGTSVYVNQSLYLNECTYMDTILNGWIFSLWGLYDFLLVNNEEVYKKSYEDTLRTLEENLNAYDLGYWTKYDKTRHIASGFYHHLHIKQMQAMYELTGIETFKNYGNIFENYYSNPINKVRAFFKKAIQKISE